MAEYAPIANEVAERRTFTSLIHRRRAFWLTNCCSSNAKRTPFNSVATGLCLCCACLLVVCGAVATVGKFWRRGQWQQAGVGSKVTRPSLHTSASVGAQSGVSRLHASVLADELSPGQDASLSMLVEEYERQLRASSHQDDASPRSRTTQTVPDRSAALHLTAATAAVVDHPTTVRASKEAQRGSEIVPPIYSRDVHPPLDAYSNVMLPTGQCLTGLACRALLALHKVDQLPLLVKAGYAVFQTGGEVNFKPVPLETRQRITHLDSQDAASYARVLITQSPHYFFATPCALDSGRVAGAILQAARNLTDCVGTRDKLCYRSFIVAIC